ncbi:MAG: diguanylate cyclase [Myxococcota bacterium]
MADDARAAHALRGAWLRQLPDRLAALHTAWAAVRQTGWDPGRLRHLRRQVHALTGSGTTFGFEEVSLRSRELEDLLTRMEARESELGDTDKETVERLLHRLLDVLPDPEEAGLRTDEAPPPLPEPREGEPLVYLVEDDAILGQRLAHQIVQFGYGVRVLPSGEALRRAMARERPDALVIDVMLPGGDLDGIDLASEFREAGGGELPIVFMSARGDIEARMAAVRAGGDAYLVKPVSAAAIVDELDPLTRRTMAEPHRVLIVEDDRAQAKVYARTLDRAGFITRVVHDPRELMGALVELRPDLILMDLYLEECSGLELAEVIRQQSAWVGIPIVFLSAETDARKQLHALQKGGDAFVTKPVALDHLVSSVAARVERSRTLRSFLTRDGLTGVLNHTALKERLVAALSHARRREVPLSYVMIDIDRFKQINDRYGHASGDRVLKGLAHLMQRRLRASDSIGRYGGEEFGVILPDTDAQRARKVIEEIAARFSRIRHTAQGESFTVTFSAGVADYPTFEGVQSLTHAADLAMYEGKRLGRDRVVVAEPPEDERAQAQSMNV